MPENTPSSAPASGWQRFRHYDYQEFVDLHVLKGRSVRDLVVADQQALELAVAEIDELEPRAIAVDFEVADMVSREFDRVIVRDGKEELLHDMALEGGTLRLIQLAVNDPAKKIRPQQWLIDLGSPERQRHGQTLDLSGLAAIFADSGVQKLIHWAEFEQEQWILRTGSPIRNIYDTCRASMSIEKKLRLMSDEERAALGFGDWQRTSSKLTDLCQRAYGFHLPKQEQQSDWGMDVLDDEQLLYAALDVATLVPLAARLKAIARLLKVDGKIRSSIARSNKEVLERLLPSAGSPSLGATANSES